MRRGVLTARESDALVCGADSLTFAAFERRLEQLHGLLHELGTARGDRVAVLSFNSIPFAELYFGVPMAGRVVMPLNFRWADPEIAYAIEDSGARVLFCDRDPGELADLVDTVVRLDLVDGASDYQERMSAASRKPFVAADEDDVIGLFYTGGTTGQSKGVMLTHRNLSLIHI